MARANKVTASGMPLAISLRSVRVILTPPLFNRGNLFGLHHRYWAVVRRILVWIWHPYSPIPSISRRSPQRDHSGRLARLDASGLLPNFQTRPTTVASSRSAPEHEIRLLLCGASPPPPSASPDWVQFGKPMKIVPATAQTAKRASLPDPSKLGSRIFAVLEPCVLNATAPAGEASLFPSAAIKSGSLQISFTGNLLNLLRVAMSDLRTPMRIVYILVLFAVAVFLACAATAQQTEKRIALVVGNAAYQAEALPTAANDAGLIAQTLQAAGFDVVGARDLDQDALRRSFRDFLDKATGSGPDTVAFIYFAGYGLQLEGENYLVPIDARIARDTDVAASALRASDYLRPLAALKLKTSIVVFDAARPSPFARSGPPLAGGLALVEPESGLLLAYNAAPGTVAPEGSGPYGAYAQALAEMMRDGGLPLTELFDRVRLRVNDMTKGAEVPGMRRGYKRHSCSLSERPMLHRPQCQLSKCRRCVRDQFASSGRKTPTPRP